ncbi:hypothetical protein Hanom_Chr09g00812491 [Helianthus anomalus]
MKSWILLRNYHNWVADYKLAPDGWYGSNHYGEWKSFLCQN